jgi:type II secretory pathway component PulL
MKTWTPAALYGAKPWILIVVGASLTAGMMLWSLANGDWTGWRGFLCLAGAALAIIGGVILQLRQDYRARSKWRRESSR